MRTLCIISLCVALCACATTPRVKVGEYYPGHLKNLDEIVAEVEKRNDTLEQHPAWISLATKGFLIKELSEVHETDYQEYRQYLDDGGLYVIVHPAYSFFFHDERPYYAAGNTVDSFLNETTYTKSSRFLREQERSLRDFLEITSTRKRLIVLVLPGGYQDYHGYIYKDGTDMFALYVNSVTNNSESVLYLYSERPDRGRLSKESKKRLLEFFRSVRPEKIILGGGYLGRCIQDFYRDFSSSAYGEKMAIAGEISSFSRDDRGQSVSRI